MRDYVIADNQDITKAGILFLLGGLKDVGNITEANNRAELIKELRTSPEAIVILDYTLFDFAGADELLILNERFPKISWILFSDELSEEFVKRVLYSSQSFSFVMKDNSKEEITSALQCAMFPLVGSTITLPGLRSPFSSAS